MIRLGFRLILAMVVICFLTCVNACEKDDPIPQVFQVVKYNPLPVVKSNSAKTYAHYMPWYETPATNNSNWGMHWTMNTQNPNITNADGKRQIASHYYPLTGPYASSDKDLIEYHLLLMKYSGIDGVLIDWYGSTDYNDYGSNRTNSEALIDALEAVGMKFAIVYEDRTIAQVVQKETSLDRITAAQNDMLYMEEHYFKHDAYILIDGSPLLLVFGPEEFQQPEQWGEIFSVLSQNPAFLTLNYSSSKTQPYSSGEYIWVDNGSLDNKYIRKDQFDVFMGGAYPGFNDFYKEGGWGAGFDWNIDHRNGDTFRQNLLKAKEAGVQHLQLITWNDYGEGTMIEPTHEFGFTLLEHVQEFTGVDYTQNELQKIFDLYQLRKINPSDDDQKKLDQAFYYLVSLQHDKAFQLIDSFYQVKNVILKINDQQDEK